ncbi:MAG: putative baseplate assembly protein [Methylocella sp.]
MKDISVARGNVILVDHGRHTGPEDLGTVPTKATAQCCECEGEPPDTVTVPGRYRPGLKSMPLTFAAPVSDSDSAAAIFQPEPRAALPVVSLTSGGYVWKPRYDLLSSSTGDRHFVVEMEEEGDANIRFGDGTLGRRPAAGASYSAIYRVGNGTKGNVGAGAISVLVHNASQVSNDITRVWNPLPARGGADPEPMNEAKLNAPYAFRFGERALQRAITGDDYATIAERNRKIQLAAGRLVWTGSWYEAEVSLDVKAAYAKQSASIATAIDTYLEDYRRIGHDLDARLGEYVSIDLALSVCVLPNYLRGHLKKALLDAFSNRVLPGGKLGFFHRDRLTFGQGIYLSAIIAVAQANPGVASVRVTRLQRQYQAPNHEIENGLLPLGHFEIVRLDNDPN